MAGEHLLEGLTAAQRQAVTHTDGPLLVLAGPGSGKTRVITHRAAYLACTVTRSEHVLAVTFTNKAAREMSERMARLGIAPGVTCTTFHSLCTRLLRVHHEAAGLDRAFTIFDEEDQRRAVREALERLGLRGENYPPAALLDQISRAKNDMRLPQACAEQAASWFERRLAEVYGVYNQVLAEQNALDFDDLLLRTAQLLRDRPDIREMLEDRYRYVLVDEYQDTNRPQYLIAAGLCLKRGNLCVTGDPDQSVYAWRGADIRNILSFEEDFPQAVVVRLEQNYRSTPRILSAADHLIARNRQRKPKALWTSNADGPAVRVLDCADSRAEALAVAGLIGEHLRAGGSPRDVAIFYRVNSQSRPIETALLEARIPYQVARGVAFFERKEIKDLLAYLRLAANPHDRVALARAVNTPPRGIGKVTLGRLRARAAEAGVDLLTLMGGSDRGSAAGKSAAAMQSFVQLIEGIREQAAGGRVRDAVEYALRYSGLVALWGAGEDESILENAHELARAAGEYDQRHPAGDGSLADWLAEISLVADVDAVDPEAGAVTLMTLHSAKGLEFEMVFLTGVEEDLLPHRRRENEPVDIEEERRLMFVGMTRARRVLVLSHSRWRESRGVATRCSPSRFLAELPAEEIEWLQVDRQGRVAAGGPQEESEPVFDVDRAAAGQFVRHPEKGIGRIVHLQRCSAGMSARILFPGGETITAILEYSDLVPVDPDEIGEIE